MRTRKSVRTRNHPTFNLSENTRKFAEKLKKIEEKYSKYYLTFIRMRFILFQSIILYWIDSFVDVRVINAPLHAELAIDDRVQEEGDKEKYWEEPEGYDGVRGKDKEEAREPDVSPPPTRKGWETVKKKRKKNEEKKGTENWKSQLPQREITRAPEKFALEDRGVFLKYSNLLRLVKFFVVFSR